jgi:hypothetical protein
MEEQGLRVIAMDNCGIHKSNALRELVEDEGMHLVLYLMRGSDPWDIGYELLFLPPYSPDYNPIEESFSCGKYQLSTLHGLPLTLYMPCSKGIPSETLDVGTRQRVPRT